MNYIQEAEQAAESFEGQQGGNNNQQQESSNNNNNNNQNEGNNQQQSSSSGGSSFLGGAEQAGEDGMINTEVNKFLNSEGLPAGADGAVDAFVDKEANQYLGGNKNF